MAKKPSDLIDALSAEVNRSNDYFSELTKTRGLVLEIIRDLSNHHRMGMYWRQIIKKASLYQIGRIQLGHYLTEPLRKEFGVEDQDNIELWLEGELNGQNNEHDEEGQQDDGAGKDGTGKETEGQGPQKLT